MKKKIGIVLLMMLWLIPFQVGAKTKSLNLKETLAAEGINGNLSDYKESDDQVTIYLFRGEGCSNCVNFLNYLNSLISDYGKYFKLEAYEVWHNKDNSEIMDKVAVHFNYDPNDEDNFGVPFIVIGNKTFVGYTASKDEEILKAITDEYNSTSRYDVFEELNLNNESNESESTAKASNGVVIATLVVGLILCTGLIIFINFRQNKKLNERLDNIERIIKVRK